MKSLSGLQIFKYLPAATKSAHSNCRECRCPTCMAFAVKLAQRQVTYDRCRYMAPELKQFCINNMNSSQKIINIDGLKIGGENVLYRHEKTFLNRTVFAIVLDCKSPDFQSKLQRIREFRITRAGENHGIDLVVLKNAGNFKVTNLCDEIVYIRENDFKKLAFIRITGDKFSNTYKKLLETRTKAILEHNNKFSSPVCVYMKHTDNLEVLCAKASFYLCKYANIIVFEDFDESLFTSLLMLRQDIFTDPQKPLQVESKVYEFNNPDENSIVFMTTNFALTFYAVAGELENLNVPSYLVVIPADGMSVLTASSAEKFTTDIVKRTLETFNLKNKVKNRKIIIPGLLAHLKDDLQKGLPDFEIVIGTVEAYAIADFVKNSGFDETST